MKIIQEKKRVLAFLVAVVFAFAMQSPLFADDETAVKNNTARVEMPTLDIPCRNAILINSDTGEVLYEKDADAPVPVASITKVMTLLLALEAVQAGKIAMTDIVPVSDHAFSMGGSQIWLEPGEQFTLDELVKAICVSSANDAAVAVGEFVGGTEPVFAEMMNKRAKELGMKNTNFKNACGLDEEGHYSSARDVAIMSEKLLHHPVILQYSQIWMDSLRGGETQLVNTNKLLKSYPGMTGLKTGTTSKAGVCISATAVRDGMGLIAVVLGSNSSKERFESAQILLDYGFATYEVAEFPEALPMKESLPVNFGKVSTVGLSYNTPEKVLVKKGEGKTLAVSYQLPEEVLAPVEEGEEIGTALLSLNGEILGTYPITAIETVGRLDFASSFSLLWKALFSF